MDLLMKKLEASSNMDTAKIMDARMTCKLRFAVMWAIQEVIVLRQGKKPTSSTMETTMGSGTTTTTIKRGTQGPTSRSTIKMEVIILTVSIISLPLKILSLTKLGLMKT
jgi:hypothetical protein